MRIALDTNRYSDLAAGVTGVAQTLERAEAILLPFAVLAELRCGFVRGTRQRENEGVLQSFLARPGVEVLYPDERTTREYAVLHEQLRRQGTPIPVSDLWIAALTVQHALHLYARDRHFDHLPQIARV
jgi:tRNA(fMet)-specific endonuclease VapC